MLFCFQSPGPGAEQQAVLGVDATAQIAQVVAAQLHHTASGNGAAVDQVPATAGRGGSRSSARCVGGLNAGRSPQGSCRARYPQPWFFKERGGK